MQSVLPTMARRAPPRTLRSSGLKSASSVSSTSLMVSTSSASLVKHDIRPRRAPDATDAGYSLAKLLNPWMAARRSSRRVALARRPLSVLIASAAFCLAGAWASSMRSIFTGGAGGTRESWRDGLGHERQDIAGQGWATEGFLGRMAAFSRVGAWTVCSSSGTRSPKISGHPAPQGLLSARNNGAPALAPGSWRCSQSSPSPDSSCPLAPFVLITSDSSARRAVRHLGARDTPAVPRRPSCFPPACDNALLPW